MERKSGAPAVATRRVGRQEDSKPCGQITADGTTHPRKISGVESYLDNPNETVSHPVSDMETLAHLLKGNIGSGILNMPAGFYHAGLYVGLFSLPILGIICNDCRHMLLSSSQLMCRRLNCRSLSYQDTAEAVFNYNPTWIRHWATTIRRLIAVFLVVSQLGLCCVYFVFVAQHLHQSIECMSGGTGISTQGYMSIIIVPIVLMCWIPELKYLAPVSMFAMALQVFSFMITFYYLVRDLPSGETYYRPAFAGIDTLPLYFSSVIYAFGAITLVLPLENKMKHPEHFGTRFGLLNLAMGIVIIMFCAVGYFGYLRYGPSVARGSITLNLPQGEILGQMATLLFGVAIFLSYPIQFYVPRCIIVPMLLEHFSNRRLKKVLNYVFIALLVLFTFALASIIPNIGKFINLVGAVANSTLNLIFPPIMYMAVMWPNTGKWHYIFIKSTLICVFGFLGFITGTYTSLYEIIEFLSEPYQQPELSCI